MAKSESFLGGEETRALLTVEEAARILRIGRSLGYELANQYLTSGGTTGMPVLRFGSCLRVPRWALMELATTGTVVCLGAGALHPDQVTVGR